MDQVRIKFYSVSDMSTGWFLHKIEEYFLEQHDSAGSLDINTALEMLNIKKFLDSGARLIQWGTRQVEEYKRKGNKIPQYIGSFCGTLSDANFSEVYSQVEIKLKLFMQTIFGNLYAHIKSMCVFLLK